MFLFGVFSLAVSPGTWPEGAWVPGGPRIGFSLLLFNHNPDIAFAIMHQNVSHVSLAKGFAPIRESCTDFHFPSTNDELTEPGYIMEKSSLC